MEGRIAAIGPWFHNFEIARGVWTNATGAGPGPDYPARRWAYVEPWFRELSGKDCLDVGCSSGFFSLKARESGAASALGIDSGEQTRAIEQARFAAEVLGLDVTFENVSVYDTPTLGRSFDVVLFMGVFYHLRHPLLALETLRKVCHGTLIFQTITTPSGGQIRELAGAAADVGLNSAGFTTGFRLSVLWKAGWPETPHAGSFRMLKLSPPCFVRQDSFRGILSFRTCKKSLSGLRRPDIHRLPVGKRPMMRAGE